MSTQRQAGVRLCTAVAAIPNPPISRVPCDWNSATWTWLTSQNILRSEAWSPFWVQHQQLLLSTSRKGTKRVWIKNTRINPDSPKVNCEHYISSQGTAEGLASRLPPALNWKSQVKENLSCKMGPHCTPYHSPQQSEDLHSANLSSEICIHTANVNVLFTHFLHISSLLTSARYQHTYKLFKGKPCKKCSKIKYWIS